MPNDQDFQSLIAPYQEQAQRFSTDTPMLGPQGMFQRLHAPGFLDRIPFLGPKVGGLIDRIGAAGQTIDRGLDNAMLAGAMVPEARGPEGAGGGISRALQGVLGAGQYRRQLALQSMMLPYQMMEPRLKAEDTFSQIHQREAMTQHYGAEDQFYKARTQHYENMDEDRESRMNQQKTVGQNHVDDEGNEWQEIFDPSKGRIRLQNPVSQRFADDPGQTPPTFKNQQKQNSLSSRGMGGFLGNAVMGAYGPPKDTTKGYTPEDWAAMGDSYSKLAAGVSYDKKKQETNVTNPIEEAHKFRDRELAGADKLVPQAPTEQERLGAAAGVPMFQSRVRDYGDAVTRLNADKAEYHASGAWKNNVGFQQWRNERDKNRTPDGPASSSVPVGSSNKQQLPF